MEGGKEREEDKLEERNAGMGKGRRGGKRKGTVKLGLRWREGETGWRRVRRSEEMRRRWDVGCSVGGWERAR